MSIELITGDTLGESNEIFGTTSEFVDALKKVDQVQMEVQNPLMQKYIIV